MSHSQFHGIDAILRHAWLNLWDKHMTTGRINQVTILNHSAGARGDPPEGRRHVNVTVRAAPSPKPLADAFGTLPKGRWLSARFRVVGTRRSAARRRAPARQGRGTPRRPIRLPPPSSPARRPRRRPSGFSAARSRRLDAPSGGDVRLVMPCYGQIRVDASTRI